MRWSRVLGILLAVSLCANLILAALLILGPGGEVTGLTNRADLLKSENERLSLQIDRSNVTLAALENQIVLYERRLEGLAGLVNASPPGPVGSATLQGPAVLQQVRYSRNEPFGVPQVIQTGVLLNISAEVKPGEGRVLVDTQPLMGLVFQDAANTAAHVAANRTGVSLAGSDVIFSIHAPGQVPAVDGPSAGALMTLLAISAIDGNPLRAEITLTGTIDEAGNVGAVGGIPEKARAARDAGKALLLLPGENAKLPLYQELSRRSYGFTIVRQVQTTVDAKTYIEENIGIPVRYVDTIDDVVRIATGPQ